MRGYRTCSNWNMAQKPKQTKSKLQAKKQNKNRIVFSFSLNHHRLTTSEREKAKKKPSTQKKEPIEKITIGTGPRRSRTQEKND